MFYEGRYPPSLISSGRGTPSSPRRCVRRLASTQNSCLRHCIFQNLICTDLGEKSRAMQWRRQSSKGARSFRGEKILQPGHPDALFTLKKSSPSKHRPPTPFHRQKRKAVRYGNIFIFCSHYYWSTVIRRARQGGARAWARAVDLPARSFVLARPGVAPPLILYDSP